MTRNTYRAEDLFNRYRQRSTELLKKQCEAGLMEIPAAPSGNGRYQFEVGQTVQCTETGSIKPGVKFVLEDRHIQNGWPWYYGAGLWHRDKDLMPA